MTVKVSFKGHELIEVRPGKWIFDTTDSVCYKVEKEGNHIVKCEMAFSFDMEQSGLEVKEYMKAPVGVINDCRQILSNMKEMSL